MYPLAVAKNLSALLLLFAALLCAPVGLSVSQNNMSDQRAHHDDPCRGSRVY